MPEAQPWTGSNAAHNSECHRRWGLLRNRSTADADYPDNWYFEQCGGCRYWIALRGEIGRDYGVCTHSASSYDGQARFEHDGCGVFTVREDGTFG